MVSTRQMDCQVPRAICPAITGRLASERTTHVIDTGRTFAETWADRDGDLRGQRALLLSAIVCVTVRPSGSKGVRVRQIDFGRVNIDWHEHDPDLDPVD